MKFDTLIHSKASITGRLTLNNNKSVLLYITVKMNITTATHLVNNATDSQQTITTTTTTSKVTKQQHRLTN